MQFKQKSFLTKSMLIASLVLIFSTLTFSLMWVNDTDGAFGDSNTGKRVAIATDVVDGAAHFLQAYSDYLLLMKKVELSDKEGVDFTEMARLLGNVMGSLEIVKATYLSIVNKAYETPYNLVVIRKLKEFDYSSFQGKYLLNPYIFHDVRYYLYYGMVRELYMKVYIDVYYLSDLMAELKSKIDGKVFLKSTDVLKLNQSMSDAMLFGQYTAMVFNDVLNR